jgi:peptidoglycan/LPS O-acetylase OafA/YrhL
MANMTSGGSADSHAIGYRADIDGLRAVAVLSVIFFHLSGRGCFSCFRVI